MLQQTQVQAVIPYYLRFLERFPDVASLARAPLDDVMRLWSGLGYYSRARNLHRAAAIVSDGHAGVFPRKVEDLVALPGIGRSTAAAVAAFAHGDRQAILDGNVKRVLCRRFGVEGFPGERAVEQSLWLLAQSLLPATDMEAYTQALMDLGATVCTRSRPRCEACPLVSDCVAHGQGRTHLLPAPRPRRVVPHRATAMLLLVHAGEVLLERRPPTGIWGGLWSLPETEAEEDAASVARARFGVEAAAVDALAPLEHGFTHFSLTIHPRRVAVRRIAPAARAGGIVWLPVAEAVGAAVPVPVRKLLRAELAPRATSPAGHARASGARRGARATSGPRT